MIFRLTKGGVAFLDLSDLRPGSAQPVKCYISRSSAPSVGRRRRYSGISRSVTPKDTSTALLLVWVEKFVVQWAQVEGALAYINLAYTRVLLNRLKDGGSVEPHQLLLEDVCSGNAAALGAEELQQASDFQDELMEAGLFLGDGWHLRDAV